MRIISQALLDFINDPDAKVAVLKGDWGTGKTYFWNDFLKQNHSSLRVPFISYVSLFGLATTDAIEKQIYINSQNVKEAKGSFIWAKKGYNSVGKGIRRLIGSEVMEAMPDIPYLKFDALRKIAMSGGVRNFLICFDDLERMEDSLTIRSVFGLINRLKEERNCKILIIYNEGQLADKKADFDIYREKVVDVEFSYKPTISDNLSIIWPENRPSYIDKAFTCLQINNIRIMHQAQVATKYFSKILDEFKFGHAFINDFMRRVVTLTIFRYAFADKISVSDLTMANIVSLYLDKDEDEDKKESIRIFKKAEYVYSDDDRIILDYLNDGWVDMGENRQSLSAIKVSEDNEAVNAALRAIWEKFHKGFSVTETEVTGEMIEFLKANWARMRLADVASLNDFLKRLGKGNFDELVDKLTDLALPAIDKTDSILFGEMLPKEVREKVRQKLDALDRTKPIPDVVFEMSRSGGWTPSDIRGLLKYTEEDYYQWLLTENKGDVLYSLKEFLSRARGDTQYNGIQVVERIEGALARLRARSPMDDLRVKNILKD
jgi:hypothetical protein